MQSKKRDATAIAIAAANENEKMQHGDIGGYKNDEYDSEDDE